MNEQWKINDIINIWVRRWWIVVLCGVLVGVFSFLYSTFLIAPMYTSSGRLYVNNTNKTTIGNMTINDINVSLKLVHTYAEILNSETFRQTISRKLDSEVSASEIRRMLEMKSVGETEILEVTATAKDPQVAQDVVQAILLNAPSEIVRVVKAGSVEIIDNANLPTSPSSPNLRNNTLLGILIGMALAILIILMIEFFDITVKTDEDLIAKHDKPVLGVIPSLPTK